MKPITTSLSERAQLRFQILEKIFKQLGDEQSRLILMHYRGYRTRDMAKELNIPESVLKNKLRAAKKDVKHLIGRIYR